MKPLIIKRENYKLIYVNVDYSTIGNPGPGQYLGEAYPIQCECRSEYEHSRSQACRADLDVEAYGTVYEKTGDKFRAIDIELNDDEIEAILND